MVGPLFDIWKNWALDLRGDSLECGHFIAEEAPDALLEKLLAFLDLTTGLEEGQHDSYNQY